MQQQTIGAALPRLLCRGRTRFDGEVLHFNWTCSGFELTFRGSWLAADFCAEGSEECDGLPADPLANRHWVWPWVSVFLDGAEQPARRFALCAARSTELLFAADRCETHRIRVVKLTENLKTFVGVRGFLLEGELLEKPAAPARRIEFIGDSITCGFGNETCDRNRFYFSEDENGWLSHAALAARMLGMEESILSISGICLAARQEIPMPFGMNALYRFTDLPGQQKHAPEQAPSCWDFAAAPADCAVINLGTNDASAAAISAEPEKFAAQFETDYIAFLRLLRACNGPRTLLVCALGSMDYYLYENIRQAAERYCRETGDRRVRVFRYLRISPLDPLGACAHPHVVTHRKMAAELAAFLSASLAED